MPNNFAIALLSCTWWPSITIGTNTMCIGQFSGVSDLSATLC